MTAVGMTERVDKLAESPATGPYRDDDRLAPLYSYITYSGTGVSAITSRGPMSRPPKRTSSS